MIERTMNAVIVVSICLGIFAIAAQLPWLVIACAAVCVAAGMLPERAR